MLICTYSEISLECIVDNLSFERNEQCMTYDVIVIGGGASGLYLAAHLKTRNALIIEKKQRVGIKLLASGSGQCNLTHAGYMNHFYECYGDKRRYVKPALSAHSNIDVIRFFESNGVNCFTRDDGKVFPQSLKAMDVLSALLKACRHTQILTEKPVTAVAVEEGLYRVETAQGSYRSKNLVIATGGKSYPTMGSEGDGYRLAEQLGFHVVSPKPGLTGVVTREKSLTALSGIALKGCVITHLRSGARFKAYNGDLLFTHFGLSGPVILNNSRWFERGDTLAISFVTVSEEVLEADFLALVASDGEKPLAFFLNRLVLPDALLSLVLSKASVAREVKLANITRAQRRGLMENLCRYPVEIENLIGYQQAMVTVGGVSLDEINLKTMESLKHEGLYFTGEVLDVDGDTGGYNLQWAFSSAWCAAEAINKKLEGVKT